jgi:hypothetical protein
MREAMRGGALLGGLELCGAGAWEAGSRREELLVTGKESKVERLLVNDGPYYKVRC